VLPLAHVGHYALWVLYVLPVFVIVAAIVRSAILTRREERDDGSSG
jgi:cytochrome c-type biogenesis protein CcmH/NrfF